MAATFPKTLFPWPALWMLATCAVAAPAEHPGKALYQKLCAECHGSKGQGVEDEYDEPLTGEKSIEALARQIDRTMPEDDPDKTTAA
ncbi:MAG: c-type cytochrome, partial [Prosthecobacter sp.]